MKMSILGQGILALGITIGTGTWAQTPTSAGSSAMQQGSVSLPFFVVTGPVAPGGSSEQSDIAVADILILDGKKAPQSVESIRHGRELPLRLGVLIDASNSQKQGGLITAAVRAASQFSDDVLIGPDDRILVGSFGTNTQMTEFMNRDQFLRFQLNLHVGGSTALCDAIALASNKYVASDGTRPARRVLVVISDGGDNQSHIGADETVAAAIKAGVTIFAVSTAGFNDGGTFLRQLSEETGGEAFRNLGSKDMPDVFARIKEQLDRMHLITYVPAEKGMPGKFRRVQLVVAPEKKFKLRAPKGYYAH